MANKKVTLTEEEFVHLGIDSNGRRDRRVRLNPEQLAELSRLRGEVVENEAINTFEQTLEEHSFADTPWKDGWLKTKEASIRIKNPDLELSYEQVFSEFRDIVSELENYTPTLVDSDKECAGKALRLVISDAHVGMQSSGEDALFSFDYNEQVLKKHLNFILSVAKDKLSSNYYDVVIIDDLGDGLDGFNKQTTRGGHELPQNMSNKQAWGAYVRGKLQLIQDVISLGGAKRYELRAAANNNHGGDFEWTANAALKMVLERMYENLDYYILNRSIEHFSYGKHTWLITHGKDKALMKKNWPLTLTPQIANIIRQYIDHYKIDAPYIHVDKGDLHQVGYQREPRFDYRNFMSLAPPSQWVQANFGVSYCGFSMQEIPKESNEVSHTDYFFEL